MEDYNRLLGEFTALESTTNSYELIEHVINLIRPFALSFNPYGYEMLYHEERQVAVLCKLIVRASMY